MLREQRNVGHGPGSQADVLRRKYDDQHGGVRHKECFVLSDEGKNLQVVRDLQGEAGRYCKITTALFD